jgi:predicted N-acetyltransferase YhbS
MPEPVPVVLLARLAIDQSEQGRQLGGHLLVDAINDQAHAFYEHFDFHPLDGHRLWRRLNDIARATGVEL